MKAKSIIYKIYSIASLAGSVLGFLVASVAGTLMIIFNSSICLDQSLFNEVFRIIKIIGIIPPDRQIVSSLIVIFFAILLYTFALIGLFVGYMEFSSTYLFANILRHRAAKKSSVFMKRGAFFSANGYRKYSLVTFGIALMLSSFNIISTIIGTSVKSKVFIALPLLPILAYALVIINCYVSHYMRYKAIGDILDISSEGTPTSAQVNSINETKSVWFKAYSAVMYIFAALYVIGEIVIAIVIPVYFLNELANPVVLYSFISVLSVLCALIPSMAVQGMMYSDLGETVDEIKSEI